MLKVLVKRAFYGDEKGVKAGDVIKVTEPRGKELEKRGLVAILGVVEEEEAEAPDAKQAQAPDNKQAQTPATKGERDPLDHDGDGKKGSSLPKSERGEK